jgi:hypothetical protein
MVSGTPKVPVPIILYPASDNCDLLLHFQDSYDGSPDLLTNTALNDIRSSGMREFVQNFVREAGPSEDHPAPDADGNGPRLEDWIRARLADLGPSPSPRCRRPKIRHFARVTVCTPQWPEL